MTRDSLAEHIARVISEDHPGTHTRLGLMLENSRQYERPGFYPGPGKRVLREGRAAMFYQPDEAGDIFRPRRAATPRRAEQ